MTVLTLLIAWAASWLTAQAYEFRTWQEIGSFAMIDLTALWLVSKMRVDYIKKRWICSVLAIAVMVSSVFMPIAFGYQYFSLALFDFMYDHMYTHYDALSVVLSALTLVIAMTPRRALYAIDRGFWPRAADCICRNCDSVNNSKGRL